MSCAEEFRIDRFWIATVAAPSGARAIERHVVIQMIHVSVTSGTQHTRRICRALLAMIHQLSLFEYFSTLAGEPISVVLKVHLLVQELEHGLFVHCVRVCVCVCVFVCVCEYVPDDFKTARRVCMM